MFAEICICSSTYGDQCLFRISTIFQMFCNIFQRSKIFLRIHFINQPRFKFTIEVRVTRQWGIYSIRMQDTVTLHKRTKMIPVHHPTLFKCINVDPLITNTFRVDPPGFFLRNFLCTLFTDRAVIKGCEFFCYKISHSISIIIDDIKKYSDLRFNLCICFILRKVQSVCTYRVQT